jgi:hypothetical protein
LTQLAHDWTDPYLEIFRQVPPAGPGVCQVCHSGPGPGYRTCASCAQAIRQVSRPTDLVLSISLSRKRTQFQTYLRDYKDGRDGVAGPAGTVLAATLGRFATRHWACILSRIGGSVDVVTTVPSSAGRPGPHPLLSLVDRSRQLHPLHHTLLRPGAVGVDHGQADDRAFEAVQAIEDARVLLVDDTFTTGARAQSAASSLARAGARAVAVLTIGRVIDPDWNDSCRAIWRGAAAGAFSFESCCWCA